MLGELAASISHELKQPITATMTNVQPRQFVVRTNSDHKLKVYLNLARRLKLTGIDQLWVADITSGRCLAL
jgi:C4-dicarboxylate-specific signal transduction histidine kinase